MSARPVTRFSRVGWWRKGYRPEQVDDYFSRIQAVLRGGANYAEVNPDEVRSVSFAMTRNGYSAKQVDAALDRIELDALDRERAMAVNQGLQEQDEAQVEWVLQMVRRKRGERFARAPWWGRYPGYAMTEVDAFCERLASTMQGGRGPGLRAVRQIEFRSQRAGYSEDQVDAFLDVVVGIMLRRRY